MRLGTPHTPRHPLGRHRPSCAPIGSKDPRGLACRGAGGPRPWTHAPHRATTWRAASARCSGALDGPLGDFLGQLRRCQLDASPVSTHLQEHVGEGQLGSRNLFIRCGSRELTIVRGTICKIRRIWHPHPHFSPKPLCARNRPRGLRHQLAPLRPLGSLWPLQSKTDGPLGPPRSLARLGRHRPACAPDVPEGPRGCCSIPSRLVILISSYSVMPRSM
jgi:hypothetical protein